MLPSSLQERRQRVTKSPTEGWETFTLAYAKAARPPTPATGVSVVSISSASRIADCDFASIPSNAVVYNTRHSGGLVRVQRVFACSAKKNHQYPNHRSRDRLKEARSTRERRCDEVQYAPCTPVRVSSPQLNSPLNR